MEKPQKTQEIVTKLTILVLSKSNEFYNFLKEKGDVSKFLNNKKELHQALYEFLTKRIFGGNIQSLDLERESDIWLKHVKEDFFWKKGQIAIDYLTDGEFTGLFHYLEKDGLSQEERKKFIEDIVDFFDKYIVLADLHIHTRESDELISGYVKSKGWLNAIIKWLNPPEGYSDPKKIHKRVLKKVDFFGIADKNKIDGSIKAIKSIGDSNPDDLKRFFINTEIGVDVEDKVHLILIYPHNPEDIYNGKKVEDLYKLHKDILALSNKNKVEDLLKFCYKNQIKVIVAHPSTGNSRFNDYGLLHKILTFQVENTRVIKAIETLNSTCSDFANAVNLALAKAYGMGAVGSSDSKIYSSGNAGKTYTISILNPKDIKNPNKLFEKKEAFLKDLDKGNTYSGGSFVFNFVSELYFAGTYRIAKYTLSRFLKKPNIKNLKRFAWPFGPLLAFVIPGYGLVGLAGAAIGAFLCAGILRWMGHKFVSSFTGTEERYIKMLLKGYVNSGIKPELIKYLKKSRHFKLAEYAKELSLR